MAAASSLVSLAPIWFRIYRIYRGVFESEVEAHGASFGICGSQMYPNCGLSTMPEAVPLVLAFWFPSVASISISVCFIGIAKSLWIFTLLLVVVVVLLPAGFVIAVPAAAAGAAAEAVGAPVGCDLLVIGPTFIAALYPVKQGGPLRTYSRP